MKGVFIASLLVMGTYGAVANAQEAGQPSYFERRMRAPLEAFEIGVSGAYNQGFGNLTDTASTPIGSRRLQDTAGAGGGAELDLSYRFLPEMAAGVFAGGSQYDPQNMPGGTDVQSLAAGLQGQWFFRPYRTINPWVGLASAYRGFWISPDVGGVTQRHGWEIARLQVGVDFRASKEISIGPYVGGAVDVFFSETLPGQTARNLSGPPASGFVNAGILGRFDLGGTYVDEATRVSKR